jgi:DNA-directed RNA polymerase subunit RPC12/RpoP
MLKLVYKCEACGKVFSVAGGELIGDEPGNLTEGVEVVYCPFCASDRIEVIPQP